LDNADFSVHGYAKLTPLPLLNSPPAIKQVAHDSNQHRPSFLRGRYRLNPGNLCLALLPSYRFLALPLALHFVLAQKYSRAFQKGPSLHGVVRMFTRPAGFQISSHRNKGSDASSRRKSRTVLFSDEQIDIENPRRKRRRCGLWRARAIAHIGLFVPPGCYLGSALAEFRRRNVAIDLHFYGGQ